MTSLAQTKANQQNAKKSTGPKTPAGKARVSQNALTHGIYAAIPLLPGEDQDKLSQLADDINAAFAPTDAMEVSIVERIIIGTIRQIRLREAEAAKLRISMSPDAIADRMGSVIRQPHGRRFYAEELSDQSEVNYNYYQSVLEEIMQYGLDKTLPPLIDIQNNAPNTWDCLDQKVSEYGYTWEKFAKEPEVIKRAIVEIKILSEKFITANSHNHKAYQLKGDLEIASRISQGNDLTLFSKYQVQLDIDIYRAMEALRKYRHDKAKIIEAEVINE